MRTSAPAARTPARGARVVAGQPGAGHLPGVHRALLALCVASLCLLSVEGRADGSAPAAVEAGGVAVTVPVTRLRNVGRGQLLAMLLRRHDDRIDFEPAHAVATTTVPVGADRLELSFTGVPDGEFAVMVVHDVDSDGELRTGWLGIPREDLAASRGAKGGPLGGPRWEDASFVVAGDAVRLEPLSMAWMAPN
jgi:uncharacterized protein (DUF2141 family)